MLRKLDETAEFENILHSSPRVNVNGIPKLVEEQDITKLTIKSRRICDLSIATDNDNLSARKP